MSHPAAAAEEIAAEVVSVAGTAFIRQDGHASAGTPKAAKPGDIVHSGDVINTSSNGQLKLLFKDKSIIDLGPSALFKVDEYKKNNGADRAVQVSMNYGKLMFAVTQKIEGKGKFKLKTPTATMGVRGTAGVVDVVDPTVSAITAAVAAAAGNGQVPTTAPAATDNKDNKDSKPKSKDAPKSQAATATFKITDGAVEVKSEVKEEKKPGQKRAPASEEKPAIVAAGQKLELKTETKDDGKKVAVAPPKVEVMQATEVKQIQAEKVQIAEKVSVLNVSLNESIGSSSSGGGITLPPEVGKAVESAVKDSITNGAPPPLPPIAGAPQMAQLPQVIPQQQNFLNGMYNLTVHIKVAK